MISIIRCLQSDIWSAVKYQYMELIETTGWIVLGFIPTYLALELYTRGLRHRKLTKLFSLIRYPKGGGVRIRTRW